MLGRVLHGLATVDNNPDLLRFRPANRSKMPADFSSLHLIQLLTAHSGAGPLVGSAFTVLSFDSLSLDLFSELLNMSLSVAGRLYHALSEPVELVSIRPSISVKLVSISPSISVKLVSILSSISVKLVSMSRMSFVSLSPEKSGMVDLRTQDPKQFLAVFTIE